jgi:hypothetical protein
MVKISFLLVWLRSSVRVSGTVKVRFQGLI